MSDDFAVFHITASSCAGSLGCPMLLQDGDTMLPRTHADCLSVADRDPVICVNRSDMGGSIRHKHFRLTSPNLY